MKLSLAEIARVIGAQSTLTGDVSAYSIDSRTVARGDLFFALRGEVHDSHKFVPDVLSAGAAAIVVDRDLGDDARLLRVEDTLVALQRLAASARVAWGGKIVGVTGSAGKTTTKDIIAALLGVARPVGKTQGNFNNHIGLPLSILRLPFDPPASLANSDHTYRNRDREGAALEIAVLEYGMNHAGEIRALCDIARPDIAVVTNVGYAHIESFDSIEGIALAKRELVESLPPDGVAILNADDERVRDFRAVHPGRTVLYGMSADADVRADDVELLEDGARFRCGDVRFESRISGRHAIRNLLAGIAVAREFGIEAAELTEAIRGIVPGKMRGERIVHGGIKVIDDCYNSNPDAVRGMLEVLRDIPAGRHIAVLGEMLELGRWAEPLHRDVGRYAVRCGITVLVGIRGGARFMVEAATDAGLAKNAAYFFDDPVEAGIRLRAIAQSGDAILFKGSRGTRVEKALESFLG